MRPSRTLLPLSLCMLAVLASAQHNKRLPRIYDLKNVEWHLSFDETLGTIDGHVVNTLTPLKPNTKQIWFDSAKLKIKEVLVNGHKAQFKVEPERLVVNLPKPGGPKDTLSINIAYSGRPEAGIYFVPAARAFPAHTSVVYTQGEMEDTHYWLPTYDYPDDKATSESFVTVPSGYTVISNGKLIGESKSGRTVTVRHRMDQPHSTYLISLVTGQFTVGNDGQFKGKPVRWNVPVGLEDMGKAAFGGTDRMIALYSKLTGVDYPYAKFDQSAVPDYMFGGMENITAVTQTIQALFPSEAAPVSNSEGLVLHELAHQWFGDDITCASWPHAWLNEGFATFLPSFYVREAHGQEAYDLSRYGTLQGGYGSAMGEQRPVVWTGYEEPIDEFGGTIYPGGASRMFVLMHWVGEEKFWKAIHNYLEEYRFKAVTTPQFFASMSKSLGVDLTPFMNEWLYRKELPKLTVGLEGKDLVINQASPYFTLDLPVWILNGSGWVKKSVHSAGPSVRLPLGELAGKPVLVDPEVYLLGSIDYSLPISAADYMAMYRNAPNAAAKMRLGEKMFSTLSAAQVLELAKEEKNTDLLTNLLPHIRDEAYLLGLLRSDDLRLVAHVISNFNRSVPTPAVVSALQNLLDTSKNLEIREKAMNVLLARTDNEELAKRAWLMPSFDEQFRSDALDYFVKHKPDTAREMALGVLLHPDSEVLRVHAITVLGNLKDKNGEHRVFDALARVAQERSFGARSNAIDALASYGNKAAIPILRPITTHSLHFMRRSAQAAIQQLGG